MGDISRKRKNTVFVEIPSTMELDLNHDYFKDNPPNSSKSRDGPAAPQNTINLALKAFVEKQSSKKLQSKTFEKVKIRASRVHRQNQNLQESKAFLFLLSLMLFLPHQVLSQCYVTSLAWSTTGFTIPNQVYSISQTAISITSSFAADINGCGYTVTYQLLNTTGLGAVDSSVFTFTDAGDCQICYCNIASGGSFSSCQTGVDTYGPHTCYNDLTYRAPGICPTSNLIAIYTSDTTKNWATPYSLTYRASVTNPSDSSVVTLSKVFTVTICTVTSYTVNSYGPIVYTIGTSAFPATYAYPTFVMVPACTCYTATKLIKVNNAAWPGINMKDSTSSMSSVFTDTGSSLQISTTDLTDGTFSYTFTFKMTLNNPAASSVTATFTVQLVNPCILSIVQDSGQTISLTTTVLATPAIVFTFNNFLNSAAVAQGNAAYCGGYTYTLSGYSGTFLTLNSASRTLTLLSIALNDNLSSPYTNIKIVGSLTNYVTATAYSKAITITIGSCVVTSYVLATGSSTIASHAAVTYILGDPAQTITLPVYTQTPACGYTETRSCYLVGGTVSCPVTWLTSSATQWTIQSTSLTAGGAYSVYLKTTLSDPNAHSITDTSLSVTIVNPCLSINGNSMIAGTVSTMITTAQSLSAVTQTLTKFKDSASNANSGDGYTLCGARTTSLTPAKSFLSVNQATNVITLSGTVNADVNSYSITVKQCLDVDLSVCASLPMTVTVNDCVITNLNAVNVGTLNKYVLSPSSTSGFTTITQIPACGYSYTVTPSISGTVLSATDFKGVTLTTANTTLSYYSTDLTIIGAYTITWTVTMQVACHGLCTITAPTTNLNWYHPCQLSVWVVPPTLSVPNKILTAMTSTSWTFTQPTDTVSVSQSPNDGLTYCGARTYTLSPTYSWLSISGNTITVASTSPADYSAFAYSITMTASLLQYTQVAAQSTVFTVTIDKCVLTSITKSPSSISGKSYIIGQAQQTLAFPTYTQTPLCGYTITYTATYNGAAFTNQGPNLVDITSGTSFRFGYTTTLGLASPSNTIVLKATFNDPLLTSDSTISFPLSVIDPCLISSGNSWVAKTVLDISTSVLLVQTSDISFKDTASVTYGNGDGFSLCGSRTYSFTVKKNGVSVTPSFITLTTTTFSSDTLRVAPTISSDIGTWVVSLVACLGSYFTGINCKSQDVNVVVEPCKVISTTPSGGLSTQIYTSYVSSPSSYIFDLPTYTQSPACGYTSQFSISATGTSTSTAYIVYPYLSNIQKYQISSSTTAHTGVYNMKLTMSFSNYPAQYSPTYTDASVTWQITIVNPCATTILDNFSSFSSMFAYVLGPSEYQTFTNLGDSISRSYDYINFSKQLYQLAWYYDYATSSSFNYQISNYLGPYWGQAVCGARTYTSNCPYLTVEYYSNLYPYLKLTPTLDSQITLGTYCTITASLPGNSITRSSQVYVVIDQCYQTGFTKSSSNPSMQSYIMMGPTLTVPFASYTKTPTCSYPISYSCQGLVWSQSLYPTGSSQPVASLSLASIPALNSMVTCDTTNMVITVDFAAKNPSVTDLTNYQYQGDYAIQVTATTATSYPSTFTDQKFLFILRVINPCTDTQKLLDPWNSYNYYPSTATIPTLTRNSLSPATINQMDTSVLSPSQPVDQYFTEFTDYTSLNFGNQDGFSLCGARVYYQWTSFSFLTITSALNNNKLSVTSTSNSDVVWITPNTVTGCNTVHLRSYLSIYTNVTVTKTFPVCVKPCQPTAFTAPTMAPQSYTIAVSTSPLIISHPYTITPACSGISIQYTATIEKTSVQSVNQPNSYATFSARTLNSGGYTVASTVYPQISFSTSLGSVYVSTNNLGYGGTYIIRITAVLQETFWYQGSTNPTFYTNSNLNYQLKMVDPCITTQVNNLAAPNATLNVVIPTLTTSVKYGQFGSAPFSYQQNPAGRYTFGTFRDSISQRYGSGSGQDYCGPRIYTLGNQYNSNWLSLDTSTGTLNVATTNNIYINISGYTVTLMACLQYYSTTCSTTLSFLVVINECKIVSFTNDAIQPNINQGIFYPVINQNLVTYTQVPQCGWTTTFTSIAYQNNFITQELPFPSWAVLNPSIPRWEICSNSPADAKFQTSYTYKITQFATLQDTYQGVAVNTVKVISFYITLIDPCYSYSPSNNFLEQQLTSSIPTPGLFNSNYNSAFLQPPLITTTVKFGTDVNPLGTVVDKTFPWHQDYASTQKNSGTYPVSGWACGTRSYSLQILSNNVTANTSRTNFISITNSIAPALPILKLITSNDADIGKWVIKMTVQLTNYPDVIIYEYFSVQIDSCLLLTLTQDIGQKYPYTSTSPYTFSLYLSNAQNIYLPSYTQTPQCGYPLLYQLTLLQQWDSTLNTYEIMGANTAAPSFVSFDNLIYPSFVTFKSAVWTDDKCNYGNTANPIDYTVCLAINQNPYQLQLRAYIDQLNSYAPFNSLSLTTENVDEQFYVRPIDPCHSATLTPWPVDNSVYFITDNTSYLIAKTTQDSISLNSFVYDTSGYSLGYGICGSNNYTVLNSALQPSDFATISSFEPPIISIYTTNIALVGLQQSYLVTNLVRYPHITANVSFSTTIYSFQIGKNISLQYYQITKPTLSITVKPFTLNPAPPHNLMSISYSYNVYDEKGVLIVPKPVFLKADLINLKFQVFTNSFDNAGVYNITIIGHIQGFQFTTSQSILLNVTKTPPPVLSIPAPVFTKALENQEMIAGDTLYYNLPPVSNPNNAVVSASLATGTPRWVVLDEKSFQLYVEKGSTDAKTSGQVGITYSVSIILQDTAGGKSINNMKIAVNPVVAFNNFDGNTTEVKKNYPVPKIDSVTSKGLITISWSQKMRIFRNLTLISNGTILWIDPKTKIEYPNQPILDIQVLPANNDQTNDLSFTWNFTTFTTNKMTIQLYFNQSLQVSQGYPLDSLQIIFYGSKYFTSAEGIPVNGGNDPIINPVLKYALPKQVPINQIKIVRRNNKAGMSSGDVPQMIFQLGISALLNEVWSMVDTQQLIILIPLFKLVLPDNAAGFFAYLFQIAAFAIIPTDPIFGKLFSIDPQNLPPPINDNFASVGFGTTYFSFNIGTLFFALMYFPIMIFVAQFLKIFRSQRFMVEQRIKVERKLYWNGTIGVIETSYTVLCICSFCQQRGLVWNNGFGPWINSFMGLFYFAVVIGLPIVQLLISWFNYEQIKSGDKKFRQRFGNFWNGFRTDDKGFIAYNFYFLFRRFWVGFSCVYFKETLIYQVAGLVFNVILATIITGEVMAYEDPRQNKLEFFNETMIMMVMYCMICFTDFLPDSNMQSKMGVVVEIFVIFHIVFNLSFVFGDYLWSLKLRYTRWKLLRMHAKSRGMQNIRLQQKQRLQNAIKRQRDLLEKFEKQLQKNLKPIQEEGEDGLSEQLHSYEYEQDKIQSNASGVSFQSIENSENDLNSGNHFEINKNFNRQPAGAPEVKKLIMKEFADSANTTDIAQNAKLGLTRPVETPMNMEKIAHQNLIQRQPLDSILPDLQAIMNQDEPEAFKLNSFQEKIQRGGLDKPLQLKEKMDPIRLLHNKIARMVDHDVSFTKVQQEPTDDRLRIVADYNSIHGKLFAQFEAGDGPKPSSTQAYNNQIMIKASKRKLIVPKTDDSRFKTSKDQKGISDYFESQNRNKPPIPLPDSTNNSKSFDQKAKQNLTNLDDLIEQDDDFGVKLRRVQKMEEVKQLIQELSDNGSENSAKRSKNFSRQQTEAEKAYDIHVKLFGPFVGKNVANTHHKASLSHQEEWKQDSRELPKKQKTRSVGNLGGNNVPVRLKDGNYLHDDLSISDEELNFGKGGMNDDPDDLM